MSQQSLNRILCVEDDADIRDIIQLTLEALGGFTVLLCASGQQALEQAGDFAPDLILLDVVMPNMDGPSTLTALRQRPEFTHTPVIFMTAKVQAKDIATYKALGAEVIAKPFDPLRLPQQVTDIWQKHQL